ncbi:hypothetical protein [Streptomyces sp. NRRL S-87]|uniref:hypothetical protein n=1 Tax=Streptomyces sp. NRRL S-87 TaxID=1463920 RepID=UPI00131C63D8|nr:hypothetical protein [Streptomyces sp. NRRL S-87]
MSTTHSSSTAQTLRDLLALAREEPRPVAAGAAARAVARTRPARTVAAAVAAAGGPDEDAVRRLAALVRDHLAGSPGRWLGVHDALAGHRGTLPDLLADVPPPAPPAAPGVVRVPAPRSVQATLALLLEHTPPQDAAAALAVFPDDTLDLLLATGPVPGPVLTDAVAGHGDTRTRTALARHTRLDARVLARLLDTGDPRVGAAVYRNPRATQTLRRTLAGRLDDVPMDEGLYAELTDPAGELPSTWLAPLLVSGDPGLTARAVAGARGVAQQYALVRVWERTGPDAVRALVDDPAVRAHLTPPVLSRVTRSLAAEDGSGAALAALRARCEPYGDPARLPALLAATRRTSTLRVLLAEPYAYDLRALSEAHAKTPFMPKATVELARHEDADDAQRLAFRLSTLNDPWQGGGRRTGNTTPPARRLASEALDDRASLWAEGMAAAGLLDPADLVSTARPAVHALGALQALARRKLLGGALLAGLAELAEGALGERPEAWAAFGALLPRHGGTLHEVITEAGKAEAAADGVVPSAAPADGGTAAAAEAPERPRTPYERAALAALDVLRGCLADGGAPAPSDPGVLFFLAAHGDEDAPGLATPRWLSQACADHGVRPPWTRGWSVAPTRDEARATFAGLAPSTARSVAVAYEHGILTVADLLDGLPAQYLLPLPGDWRRQAFATAWQAGVARLLRTELGADPDAWLRLAGTVAAAGGGDLDTGGGGLTWPELVRLARSGEVDGRGTDGADGSGAAGTDGCGAGAAGDGTGEARTGERAATARRPLGQWKYGQPTPLPATPEEAVRQSGRGSHLWQWPIATMLCMADADTVDAVLPRLGPDGPWLLAAYLLRHERTPRTVLDRLLAGRDPRAMYVLAAGARRLPAGTADRLADLGDPEVDYFLLAENAPEPVRRRIVRRSRAGGTQRAEQLGKLVLERMPAGPWGQPAGSLRWLASAEPDLVEAVLTRSPELSLVQQLTGCLHLVEHGGRDRLAALVARGVLGRAATKLCAKALASADPAAVVRARLALETDPVKLAAKLRTASGEGDDPYRRVFPHAPDWDVLAAEHAKEPLPQWAWLVRRPDAPLELRLRHPELAPEPGPGGLPEGPEFTRARSRFGLGGLYSAPPVMQFDGLLASGHLRARDLLEVATPAVLVLSYLSSARLRTDAPPEAAAALEALADLVGRRLGTDRLAWERVVRRLTGRDPGWDAMSPVTALLD